MTTPKRERGFELAPARSGAEGHAGHQWRAGRDGPRRGGHRRDHLLHNTSNPSVMLGAGLVAKKAVDVGLKIKPYVKTSLAPGSRVVTDYLKRPI